MKKILLTIMAITLFVQTANAKNISNIYDKASKCTGIHKGSVSVSVKDIDTHKVIIKLHSDAQVSPASTQKILTYFAAYKTLGDDYNFTTKLYKTKNNDYYLVLGADPYLTGKDLKVLLSNIKIEKEGTLKNFYIDDSILDNNNWGEGWQWDDSLNTLMPKFGSYNIDRNLYTIIVNPTKINSPASLFTEIFYPTTFINKTITTLHINNVKVTQEENDISPDALTVSGEVAKTTKIKVPVAYLRRYFILRLNEAFKENDIYYTGKYERAKVPANAELIAQIEHPIELTKNDVLKRSNNLVAETIFKVAGGKYAKNTGSHANAMAMFNNYCKENQLDCSNIRLTDGSGVSKNNLVTADFMTNYLTQISKTYDYDTVKTMLPTSGEGTLAKRMPMLKDKIYAKTGTLANISGITGYLEAQSGKKYAFAIYINDGNSEDSAKKLYEEIILRELYKQL